MIDPGHDTSARPIHPPPARLAAFGLGKVDGEESARIADHLSGCETCSTLVEVAADDRLAALIREAKGQRTTIDIGEGAAAVGPPPAVSPSGYEVIEVLGEGGMGVVYKARQVGLGRFVALKQLRADVLQGRDGIARFRREAEAVARLRHPNIVPIFDVGWRGDVPYFSMEYVEGGTLARRLAAGPIAPGEAARLVETLARAVQHAHDQGVVHRDLKPSNVLLAPDLDRPKVADFGLAKLDDDATRTGSGAILGTPNYMAPEQAGGDSTRVGPPADIHALGAILYEALAGRPPFQAPTVLETLELVRSTDPSPPRQIRREVPRDLETIALRCLEKSPERRYRSAGALADDLRRHLDGETILARPASGPERLAKWARRRPWQATSATLVVLLAVGGFVGVLAHNARLRDEVRRTEKEAEEARTQRARAENQYRSARAAIRRMIERFDDPKFASRDHSNGLGFRRQILEDALTFYDGAVADDAPAGYSARLDKIHALMEAGHFQILIDRYEDAIGTFRRSVELLRNLEREFGTNPEIHREQVSALVKLGAALAGAKKIDESVRVHEEAIATAERARQGDPASIGLAEDLAWSRHNLSSILLRVGRGVEAEPHLLRAAEIRRTHQAAHPEQVEFRVRLAESLTNLALIHAGGRNTDRAESEYAEAAGLLATIPRDRPDQGTNVLTLAKLQLNWGMLAMMRGKTDLAIDRFQAGRDAIDAVLRNLPDWPEARHTSGQLAGAAAYGLSILGRHREALPLWDRAISLAAEEHRTTYHLGRGASLAHEGRGAEAMAEADAIAGGSQSLSGVDFYNLACVAAIAADRDLAESAAIRSLRWLEAARSRGIFRDPRMVDSLKADRDFQPIRRRADFQLFQLDLAFPADPFR